MVGQFVTVTEGKAISSAFTVVDVVEDARVVDVVVVLDVVVEVVLVVVESWAFVVVVVDVVLVVFSTGSIDLVTLSDSDDPQEMNAKNRITVRNFLTIISSYQISLRQLVAN